jgi:hypothetical protein
VYPAPLETCNRPNGKFVWNSKGAAGEVLPCDALQHPSLGAAACPFLPVDAWKRCALEYGGDDDGAWVMLAAVEGCGGDGVGADSEV